MAAPPQSRASLRQGDRRELRRLSDAKVEIAELRDALMQEVIKREVTEGEKADAARKKVAKMAGKMLRVRKEKEDTAADGSPIVAPTAAKAIVEA